jgi:hypothetical protein
MQGPLLQIRISGIDEEQLLLDSTSGHVRDLVWWPSPQETLHLLQFSHVVIRTSEMLINILY